MDYIRSYLNNKYIEIETSKKRILESNWSIIFLIIMYCFLTIYASIHIKVFLIGFLIPMLLVLLLIFIVIDDNWTLRLENNTIFIKRKLFPIIKIDVKNLVNIQNYTKRYKYGHIEYLQISYFNDKDKIKNQYIAINNRGITFAEEDKIKEFKKSFSYYSVSSENQYIGWKNIDRNEEQIEKIEKRFFFNIRVNQTATAKDLLIAIRSIYSRYSDTVVIIIPLNSLIDK